MATCNQLFKIDTETHGESNLDLGEAINPKYMVGWGGVRGGGVEL